MEKLIAKYLIEDLIIEIKQLKENKSVEYKIACDDIINLIEKMSKKSNFDVYNSIIKSTNHYQLTSLDISKL